MHEKLSQGFSEVPYTSVSQVQSPWRAFMLAIRNGGVWKKRKLICWKTVPSNRRTTRSCNNDHSLQFTLMPLSTAKKAATARNCRIFSRWLINIKQTDDDENDRMGERAISLKLAGVGNRRAVGSGGAERRRRPTLQPTSETDSNTEIHETRSAKKAKHGYSRVAVFFTTWTRKQRESWMSQVETLKRDYDQTKLFRPEISSRGICAIESYSMSLNKDWNMIDMNELSLTYESENLSSLRRIVTPTTRTMSASMENIEL